MEDFINFLQEFVFNIMVALAPIITGFLIAWVKAIIDEKIAALEAAKPKLAAALKEAASLAVQAAEQAGAAGLISDKKEYAMELAQKWLNLHGWDEIDLEVLDAAIEAEVNKLYPNEGAVRYLGENVAW